jgi:phosphoadenosine phosphosulfate reductase
MNYNECMVVPPDLQEKLQLAPPDEILLWVWNTFGELAVSSSSFQSQSVVLLYLIGKFVPKMPVYFLETGFHFPETLAFRDELTEKWGLNVVNITPEDYITKENLSELRLLDPDYCCLHAKVSPLQRALHGKQAWVTGIRRDQTSNRRDTPVITEQSGGLLKVAPLASWSRTDLRAYITENNLPAHPLEHKGYRSIGCEPCTVPVVNEYDERSGRWVSYSKTECGLHTLSI